MPEFIGWDNPMGTEFEEIEPKPECPFCKMWKNNLGAWEHLSLCPNYEEELEQEEERKLIEEEKYEEEEELEEEVKAEEEKEEEPETESEEELEYNEWEEEIELEG